MVKSFYIKGNFIMRIMACFQKKCKGPLCEKKVKLRKYLAYISLILLFPMQGPGYQAFME